MYRVCLTKTGKLIEMQSGGRVERLLAEAFEAAADYDTYSAACDAMEAARLETLKTNAVNAGHKEADIEVKWVSESEWQAILAAQPKDEVAAAKAKLAEIDIKSIRSIREWVAAQPNAPQLVLDYEAQAKNERNKLA